MPIRGEYVGTMPEEEGNYVVFDLQTDDQWVSKLFRDGEDNLKVLCGRDNTVHDAEDHDFPNVRWVRITPLTRAEIEKYLGIPA
jgi:hypothetical protein